jgi:hypothetical protein
VTAEWGTGIEVTAEIDAGDCVFGEEDEESNTEVGMGFWIEVLMWGQ